jgi:hypothetical protein
MLYGIGSGKGSAALSQNTKFIIPNMRLPSQRILEKTAFLRLQAAAGPVL